VNEDLTPLELANKQDIRKMLAVYWQMDAKDIPMGRFMRDNVKV
jgi:hypothetical protein